MLAFFYFRITKTQRHENSDIIFFGSFSDGFLSIA
jgi:hypothetical protein